MPQGTSDTLMGVGMPAQMAAVVGANPSTLVTTGTAQATAAILKTKNVALTTAASQTGVIPPAGFPVMEEIFIVNPTATGAVVYVPVGDTLNGTLNGTLALAQNKACILYQYKKGFWATILTA